MTSKTRVMNISSKSESKIPVDCTICTETVSQRKIVECPFCKFQACGKCVETFLLGIDDDRPRCMNTECKKIWTYDFLSTNLSPSFYNKKYRDRRATLLYEREKSLLPGTQSLVAAEILRKKNVKNIANLHDENAMYKELIRSNDEKIRNLHIASTYVHKKENDKRTFTRSCPVENCRGFLSTSLKCGICNGYACKDCHLPKDSKNDDDHKCDPDLVATVKLLANDTKPCPACSTPIYKIQGCDQMYCTQCHTPFSWDKGTIERGVIHNPHFYAFQAQQNGGIAPRRNAALRCGGPPNIWEITYKLEAVGVHFHYYMNAHRLINHINIVELPTYPNTVGEMDNSSLRVKYLMNDITEKQWISKLKNKMKKQEKDSEIHMVLSMFTSTLCDLFGNIVSCEFKDVDENIVNIDMLREYTNKSLKKIGIHYDNIYPFISPSFEFWKNSKHFEVKKKGR